MSRFIDWFDMLVNLWLSRMDNDRPAIRNFFRRLFSCSSTPNIIDRSSKMHRNGKFSNRKVKKRASVRTNSYSFFTSQQRSKSTSRLRTVSRSSQSSSASSSRVFSNEVSYHPAARKKIHSSSSFLQTEYHVEDRNRDLWSWITMGSYKSSLPRPASWYGYMGQGCTFEVIPLDKLDNPPVLQTFQPLPITSIRPLIPKACHDVGSHGSDRLWISSGSLIDTGRNILNPEESDEEEELNREVECYLREIEFQKSSKNVSHNLLIWKKNLTIWDGKMRYFLKFQEHNWWNCKIMISSHTWQLMFGFLLVVLNLYLAICWKTLFCYIPAKR